MSCMTHVCRSCDFVEFNNNQEPTVCPKCGGAIYSTYDDEIIDNEDVDSESDSE